MAASGETNDNLKGQRLGNRVGRVKYPIRVPQKIPSLVLQNAVQENNNFVIFLARCGGLFLGNRVIVVGNNQHWWFHAVATSHNDDDESCFGNTARLKFLDIVSGSVFLLRTIYIIKSFKSVSFKIEKSITNTRAQELCKK